VSEEEEEQEQLNRLNSLKHHEDPPLASRGQHSSV